MDPPAWAAGLVAILGALAAAAGAVAQALSRRRSRRAAAKEAKEGGVADSARDHDALWRMVEEHGKAIKQLEAEMVVLRHDVAESAKSSRRSSPGPLV